MLELEDGRIPFESLNGVRSIQCVGLVTERRFCDQRQVEDHFNGRTACSGNMKEQTVVSG